MRDLTTAVKTNKPKERGSPKDFGKTFFEGIIRKANNGTKREHKERDDSRKDRRKEKLSEKRMEAGLIKKKFLRRIKLAFYLKSVFIAMLVGFYMGLRVDERARRNLIKWIGEFASMPFRVFT